ncbi:ABC transporter ATP-binding protein [Candidatus Methanoliparum sp. LAM-1]|uniref:ABC transporter ATP-binding protein n=1 Tax=Candidatus Methanoliparum sp. LAM-1 TaxID=2874846 RepID=UPI001E356BBF|nr:ABC transporter ATP-binding protein [Candidatus Methanoliparum sp. LAM-1]BDC36204.1 ABC transporter ATP-binding protein [Candidatus Methanoliparum sp. LAM-1]
MVIKLKYSLEIRNLAVDVDGGHVLKDVNLMIEKGETHVLLGPNGSGKTTLLLSILGLSRYKVVRGEIIFKGRNIVDLPIDERVKMGIGIAFQNPPIIRGISLNTMLNVCMGEKTTEITDDAVKLAKELNFSEDFLTRDVNYGFSGGEIKRSEIMQLIAQQPDFIMFDEPDSGLDIENMELIGKIIGKLLERDLIPSRRKKMGLIITHLATILDYINADRAHVMLKGKIACSGYPKEILDGIRKNGYEKCIRTCQEQ